ncbi:hypothetical protein BJV74DRAFT_798791 [Russula compacta]|nr:hypothetical protein BJV74DRAFT_798791 [Russula compacta]
MDEYLLLRDYTVTGSIHVRDAQEPPPLSGKPRHSGASAVVLRVQKRKGIITNAGTVSFAVRGDALVSTVASEPPRDPVTSTPRGVYSPSSSSPSSFKSQVSSHKVPTLSRAAPARLALGRELWRGGTWLSRPCALLRPATLARDALASALSAAASLAGQAAGLPGSHSLGGAPSAPHCQSSLLDTALLVQTRAPINDVQPNGVQPRKHIPPRTLALSLPTDAPSSLAPLGLCIVPK